MDDAGNLTPPSQASSTVSSIVSVDSRTFTSLMEQLQEGYVASIAAAAGCTMEPIRRDIYGLDVRFVRPGLPGEEEVVLSAQLKNTTTIKPDLSKSQFSYQLKKREYLETLAAPRTTSPKAILLVMVTTPAQAAWIDADHDSMTVRHCCYWAYLEGRRVDPNVSSPTVHIKTDNIFDSNALASLMDKLSSGERLE